MEWSQNNNNNGGGGGFNSNDGGNFNAGGFSGTQFGNGGGGFMADGDGKFGSQPGFSQSQSPSVARKRDEQSLVPVTIKQIKAAEQRDSKFKIDGKDINQVTLLGAILSVEIQPTNIMYLLDDGSGKINVRLYVDVDGDAKALEAGTYVRVVGNLRMLGAQVSVVGFQLLPVTDFNEITFHNLEVIHTHLQNTRGAPAGGAAPGGAAPAGQQNHGNGNTMNSSAGVIGADGSSGNAGGNGSSINDQVMQVFSQDSADAGTHVDQVCSQLSHIPKPEILKAIEFLSDEGHLYSTIDEQHFKSTASA